MYGSEVFPQFDTDRKMTCKQESIINLYWAVMVMIRQNRKVALSNITTRCRKQLHLRQKFCHRRSIMRVCYSVAERYL